MKYVAFIPLRGGSKSIPRKNILPMAGKPLCQWVIDAALGARHIDHVYVATDSPEIAAFVEALGHPRLSAIGRSPETATDTASTESAMLEFAEAREFETMVLIQATSPLLASTDLDAAIEHFERAAGDSMVSVVAQKRFIWGVGADGVATAQNYVPKSRPRRQDFSPYFVENGAFYLSKRDGLLRERTRLFGRMLAHEMPEETFHELDEPVDWKIIEGFLRERARGGDTLRERARKIRIVLSDVDGVLTDSGMYYSETGDELKKFNTRDGKGFELLRLAGIQVGIITAENTKLVERRTAKMRLHHLVQGCGDKLGALREILAQTGFSLEEVAYIGDDLGDVEILGAVGLAACPRDATPEAKRLVHHVCEAKGGEGPVREFAELILSLR